MRVNKVLFFAIILALAASLITVARFHAEEATDDDLLESRIGYGLRNASTDIATFLPGAEWDSSLKEIDLTMAVARFEFCAISSENEEAVYLAGVLKDMLDEESYPNLDAGERQHIANALAELSPSFEDTEGVHALGEYICLADNN